MSGREIVTEAYDRFGRMTSRSLTEYQGRLERIRGYDADGSLNIAMDMEKDDDGNTTRMVFYDEDTGSVSSMVRTTFTNDGRRLAMFMYDEDEKLLLETQYSYTYGEDGMDEIVTGDSFLAGYPYKTTITGMTTKVDAFGNWTEKRSYEREENFGIVEWVLSDVERRSITYR